MILKLFFHELKQKKKKGMTFVEIVVTISILNLILIPLFSLSLTSTKISRESNKKILAATLAQQCVESIKASGSSIPDFSSLGLSPQNDNSIVNALSNEDAAGTFQVYDMPSNDDYRNIYVKVKYDVNNSTPIDEYSDAASYDVIFDVYKNSISNRNTIMINNVDAAQITGSNIKICVENNTDSTLKYGLVTGNSTSLPDNYTSIIRKNNSPSDKSANVKVIMHSTSIPISIDLYGKNDNSSLGTLNVDFLKVTGSTCTYNLITDGDVKSSYKQFDSSSTNGSNNNSLMQKYNINVEVWYYDGRSSEKNLLQKISTSRLF